MPTTRKTRKQRKQVKVGGGWLPFTTQTQLARTAANNAKQRAAINMARSKSRVANILTTPGEVVYTNKERIASELADKLTSISQEYGVDLDDLKRDVTEKKMAPNTVVDTLKNLTNQLKPQLQAGPTAGQKAFVITIPFALGQLTFKVLRFALYITLTFLALMTTIGSGGMIIPSTMNPFASIAPNGNFSSTKSFYNRKLKQYSGVSPNNQSAANSFSLGNPMLG
jgi:hypothetical protein